jgi:hypothetical protein
LTLPLLIIEKSIIPPLMLLMMSIKTSLKYSNNKMGINDVINKLSINNTRANLLHSKLIKRNLNFNEWMHKLKKLKIKSCVRLIHSLLFIFSLMIDSLIKQQTAWSQGSSKYQKQKKCTCSEISINLSFYVYIIPKKKQLFFKFK